MIKNNALISRSANNLLKIIFELIVLIHHLYWTKTELGANISALLGPLAVGGFLFCSGYGVGVNYKKKGDEYLKRLSFSRIPYFYLVIIVTNLFYLSLFYLTGNSFTDFWSFIVSILNLEILRSYVKLSHWLYFISDLMLYYLLFVLGMIIFKKRNNRLLLTSVFILIIDILIIVVLSIINYITGSTRFLRACVLFPIGVLASVYNDKLCKIINKYKFIIAGSLLVLGVILFTFLYYKPMVEYVICSVLVLFIIVLFYGVSFENKSIDFISKLVIYVYLSHELFFKLIIYYFPNWTNAPVIAVTLCCSFVSALCLYFIKSLILKVNLKKTIK